MVELTDSNVRHFAKGRTDREKCRDQMYGSRKYISMGEHESFLGTSQGAEVDSKPQPRQLLIILSPISSTHESSPSRSWVLKQSP